MQLDSCNSIVSDDSKYERELCAVQSDSYYSLFFARDLVNKRDVLWVDINIEGSNNDEIESYMNTVASCINDNPTLFVSFYDYWVSDGNNTLTVITEKPAYGCITDLVQNTSKFSLFSSDSALALHHIKLWLLSLLRMMDVTQTHDPPILMSSLSNNSIYFSDSYETIKFALFPFVINSGLLNSYDMLRYLPMETIENKVVNESTMMYSLGICLYEMLTKSDLFSCNDKQTLLQLKTNDSYIRKELASIDNIFFRDLVIRLLGPSNDRPSSQSILHELNWISMDSSLTHIDSLSIRSLPPTMEVLMNRASNPASLRCSLSSDRDDLELLFPDKSYIPEYEALGTAVNVDFYKLDLTFDFSDGDTTLDDKDHVAFSIVSRIDCYLKIKVTRKRSNGSRSSFYLMLKYGTSPISVFVSNLSRLNIVPEVMIDSVTENVELWLDNYVKSLFASKELIVSYNTFI